MDIKEQKQKVALRHVAARAGVSLGTASNVFANKPGVASKTRIAVITAAEELGYQPVQAPAHEQTPFVHTLGLVIRAMEIPISANPFYSHVLQATERTCAVHDISLMYTIVDEHVLHIDQLPSMIQRKQAQGLLVLGYYPELFFTLLRQSKIPFVMIDHYLPALQVDSVTNDDVYGGYLATRYLLERGHRHPAPALIAGPLEHYSFAQRWAGYRQALSEYGVGYRDDYVREGDSNASGGYAQMNALLDLEVRPSAVFCANDSMALGALNALQERGMSVPGHCSVVGYDDIDLATHSIPPLTTIRVDKEFLGVQGIQFLLERIEHPERTARHVSLAATLVERGSVASKV